MWLFINRVRGHFEIDVGRVESPTTRARFVDPIRGHVEIDWTQRLHAILLGQDAVGQKQTQNSTECKPMGDGS